MSPNFNDTFGYGKICEENKRWQKTALGVSIGVVTDIKDPDNKNKVKVELKNRGEGYITDFIDVASPMAGKESGFLFMPEVGETVLVAYIDGDSAKPVVIARLWDSENAPPAKVQDGKNDIRMIKSRNGNTITLDDTEGKEKVIVETKAGLKVSLDDEKQAIDISDKDAKNTVKIDAKGGNISINANTKIEFKAGSGTVTIDKNGVKVDGSSGKFNASGSQVIIEGSSKTAVSGGMLNLEASGNATLKGAIVKIN